MNAPLPTSEPMFSVARLAAVLPDARLHGSGQAQVLRVSTDSRDIRAGDLFIALRGERFDAHAFLPQVAAQGAVAALVERVDPQAPLAQIEVADTRRALGRLAAHWRQALRGPLVAVTGSNGKTTVKEMIATIFAQAFGADARLATQGNLNNDIGLPLTLLNLRARHRVAVVELGMNHPGETAELAAIAQPTVALINNAQREHQEFMVSVAAVAAEHGAVLAALPADGVAVFPADSEFSGGWRTVAGPCRVLDFGLDQGAVRGHAVACAEGQQLYVSTPHGGFDVQLRIAGVHNLRNALAATACALGAGVELAAIRAGLAAFAPVKGRLQTQRFGTLILIDDSYNANPDSVRAAIDVLAATATAGAPTTLILGDMGEVGDQGPEFHREIGAYARQKGIARFYACGALCRFAAEAYGPDAVYHAAAETLLAQLQDDAQNLLAVGGAALVKGSRFMRMERALDVLRSTAQTGATSPIHTTTAAADVAAKKG